MKRGKDSDGVVWEECTLEQWDNCSDSQRGFINFGDGFVPARKVKE